MLMDERKAREDLLRKEEDLLSARAHLGDRFNLACEQLKKKLRTLKEPVIERVSLYYTSIYIDDGWIIRFEYPLKESDRDRRLGPMENPDFLICCYPTLTKTLYLKNEDLYPPTPHELHLFSRYYKENAVELGIDVEKPRQEFDAQIEIIRDRAIAINRELDKRKITLGEGDYALLIATNKIYSYFRNIAFEPSRTKEFRFSAHNCHGIYRFSDAGGNNPIESVKEKMQIILERTKHYNDPEMTLAYRRAKAHLKQLGI